MMCRTHGVLGVVVVIVVVVLVLLSTVVGDSYFLTSRKITRARSLAPFYEGQKKTVTRSAERKRIDCIKGRRAASATTTPPPDQLSRQSRHCLLYISYTYTTRAHKHILYTYCNAFRIYE